MKKLFIGLFTNFFIVSSIAQTAQQDISIGSIETRVKNGGNFIEDKFQPKGYDFKLHTIYAAFLQFSCKDSNNNTYVASSGYKENSGGSLGYVPGPYTANSGMQTNINRYDHVWKVSRCEINNHKLLYNKKDYNTPNDILTWPANGDTSLGEPALLAPFYDKNNNQKYEPNLGEYPIIKGDEAALFIINDNAGDKKYIKSEDIKLDIIGMVYAFNNKNDDVIQNTIFLETTVTNRSNRTYQNFKEGYWVDLDIGYSEDDYTGCSVADNLFYVYNGDSIDNNAYVKNLVTQGVIFLTDSMTNYISFSNLDPVNDPIKKSHIYNYMNSTWSDGVRLTTGGNGYNKNSTAYTNYSFPANPKDTFAIGWSERKAKNKPGDRRGIGCMTKGQFSPNESFTSTIAFLYSLNEKYTSVDSLLIKTKILKKEFTKLIHTDTTYKLKASGVTTFCKGSSVNLAAPKGFKYQWSNNSTNQNITINETGVYSCVLQDTNGCVYLTDTINVNVSNLQADMKLSKYKLLVGDSITGNITQAGIYYTWDMGDGTLNNTQVIQHKWDKPGDYLVTCQYTDSICLEKIIQKVHVSDTGIVRVKLPEVYLPNDAKGLGYTPFLTHCDFVQIKVYNRWGQLCYNSINNQLWHGQNNNNEELPSGTYIVVIDVNATNKQIISKTGAVSIIR